jgi:hypothetical protein
MTNLDITYEFVRYGEIFEPRPQTVVLDVGMKTVPGVIDHHQADAEPECTASLIAKSPRLVLDHLRPRTDSGADDELSKLHIITHRLPDFDSVASIFLTLRLIELGRVDAPMARIATYTKLADSASLSKDIDLTATPYAILRALFSGAKREESLINQDRVAEGLKFMKFLYDKAEEGYDIEENRTLFSGIDRYERARRKIENDYFHYLDDQGRGQKVTLELPRSSGAGKKAVDGLIVRNPSSFLLKEWARRDRAASPLGAGFSLLVTNFGGQRYILGVDPERGVNLRGLGESLNRAEARKREADGRSDAARWYEGNCSFFNYRIIDSPQRGTILSHQDVVQCLLDFSRAPRQPNGDTAD